MISRKLLYAVLIVMFTKTTAAQEDSLYKNWKHKKNIFTLGFYKQPGKDSMVDVWDGINRILGIKHTHQDEKVLEKPHYSILPGFDYQLNTGFGAVVVSNLVLPPTKNSSNKSVIYLEGQVTQKKQAVAQLVSNLWFAGSKFNLSSNWTLMRFPQNDYGMGIQNSLTKFDAINYSNLKLHQTLSTKIGKESYAGIGFNFDYHWNIVDTTSVNKPVYGFAQYGLSKSSISSGIVFSYIYDSRRQIVNPVPGSSYLNISMRNNLKFLGSNSNWSNLLLDFRKYVAFPNGSKNILAFWSYNTLNLHGSAPYLDLPSTASDPFRNVGRGYIQNRFRGKSLISQEAEYRFGITENGFLGGVIFGNVQSIANPDGRISRFIPACGAGIRIKYNKKSNTSMAFDYAIGKDGSRGFFLNLGEVF